MNVPSVAIVTLPPCVVAKVPAAAATPAGESLLVSVPVSATNGVVGEVVVPPVTTACVLFTRFPYESLIAFGWIAIERPVDPVHELPLSVAVTVNEKVPVAVGVPLIAPALDI